jgi:hypothetical protein
MYEELYTIEAGKKLSKRHTEINRKRGIYLHTNIYNPEIYEKDIQPYS